jgi:hypothetical protein
VRETVAPSANRQDYPVPAFASTEEDPLFADVDFSDIQIPDYATTHTSRLSTALASFRSPLTSHGACSISRHVRETSYE